MFSNQSAELPLDVPCKALDAVRADKVESRFIVGSCSIFTAASGAGGMQQQQYQQYQGRGFQNNNNNGNHLYVLRFHSQVNELGIDGKIDHPTGPVGVLRTSPKLGQKSLLWTAPEQRKSHIATLWKLPSSVMNITEELSYDPDEDDAVEAHNTMAHHQSSDFASAAAMEEVVSLDSSTATQAADINNAVDKDASPIVDIIWRGGGDDSDAYLEQENNGISCGTETSAVAGEILTLDRSCRLTQWDIRDAGGAKCVRSIQFDKDSSPSSPSSVMNGTATPTPTASPSMVWDPHNVHAVAVTCGNKNSLVKILDWRVQDTGTTSSSSLLLPTQTVESFAGAHRYGVTDLDYNPNKPYVLATSGQDGLLKYWDLRYATKGRPLLIARGGHSHWANSVKYNPFHDQLVLSTGTDAVVNLWRVSTISSAPLLLTLEGEEEEIVGLQNNSDTSAPNVRVARYEHADSVYGAAWGAADAWVYATVGYDGKVALHHVPSKEKYKILL